MTKKQTFSFMLLAIFSASVFYSLQTPGVIANNRPPSTIHNVSFNMQAPFGEWSDPRQMDGCEEAALVMAMAWVRGGSVPNEEALRDIINISEYERVIFGFYQDTSITDTARLLQEFYGHKNYTLRYGIAAEDIKNEIAAGRIALIPLNTRLTGMPFYRLGPVRHTVVAVGYDDQSDEIIVHDPFYAKGQYLRIPSSAIDRALWDYQSGVHLSNGLRTTSMISISK